MIPYYYFALFRSLFYIIFFQAVYQYSLTTMNDPLIRVYVTSEGLVSEEVRRTGMFALLLWSFIPMTFKQILMNNVYRNPCNASDVPHFPHRNGLHCYHNSQEGSCQVNHPLWSIDNHLYSDRNLWKHSLEWCVLFSLLSRHSEISSGSVDFFWRKYVIWIISYFWMAFWLVDETHSIPVGIRISSNRHSRSFPHSFYWSRWCIHLHSRMAQNWSQVRPL